MGQNDFVPLSYYVNPNIIDFLEIPDDTLDKMGFLETEVKSDEIVKDLGPETHTFYDELEGKEVTVSWTDAEIKRRRTKIIITLASSQELSFKIPGIDGIELVLASTESPSASPYTATFTASDDGTYEFSAGVILKIRFARNLLKPMNKKVESTDKTTFKEDTSAGSLEVEIGKVELKADSTGGFSFGAKAGFSINKPAMIGDTGVIIDDVSEIVFNLDGNGPKPQKALAGWKGLYIGSAKVYIPDILNCSIGAKDLGIGSGGFYGEIKYSGAKIESDVFGMKGSISSVNLEFVQSIPTEATIKGDLQIPFFDAPVDVEIGINLDGGFAVKLAGSNSNGLYKLTKKDLLEVELDSLGFEVQDGVFTAKLSGEIKPLVGNLVWPAFEVKELSIDSEGNVHIDGGWLNLRKKYSLSFYGFKLEITKLGFGKTEDGGKWIGFSGGLKLVDGLPVGASVEGLRIIWHDTGDPQVTFNGIGVEFEVPNVLRFKGAVAYQKRENNGTTEHRFDGDIKLKLIALNLELDCELVIGRVNGDPYMGIYLNVELPAGIPLWSTGVALYGMAGLFAQQMEPNKAEKEAWYGVDRSNSWYHREPIGVTSLTKKWEYMPGSLALGAGVTIGTVSDNGYIFSGKVLLVIVFPGPVLLIEGKANMLKKRTKLDEEPLFRALAVLDARAGTFLIGLDAQYKYASGGELIEIGGSAEMFFNLNDASAWHLYLGQKEPREKRIQARIFKLFGASSYFMLDAHSLAFGSWVGYGNSWKFGPLGVTLEAWLEYNVGVSWSPPHLHGDILVHGKGELKVFWFEFGLSLDAGVKADVFDPFHLLGKLSVGINLPWPLPDFSVGITLEWGPRPDYPPLPKPLKEIAIEHFKVTESWPLPAGKLLLPIYDKSEDGFIDTKHPSAAITPPKQVIPVVPFDCRPHITFSRPLHDDALVGLNPQPPQPAYERIGDPEKDQGPVKLRYGLKEVVLQRWAGSAWDPPVARKAAKWDSASVRWVIDPNPPGVSELFGSWAPVPAMPDGGGKAVAQTKLWLWSKTPFDYTRHSGRFWDEWFTDRFSIYPCLPIPPDKEICYDFEEIDPTANMTSPWAHPDEKNLILQWIGPQVQKVFVLSTQIERRTHTLCFPCQVIQTGGASIQNQIIIILPQPAKEVKLIVRSTDGISKLDITGYDAKGIVVEHGVIAGSSLIGVSGKKTKQMITRVVIENKDADLCLLAVCISVGMSYDEISRRLEMETHLRNETARWEQTGVVLEPYTTYRLKIVTTLKAEGEGELSGYSDDYTPTEFAYFRTEGPPGLTKLGSGLDDLVLYVKQTVPATVPTQGQKPLLPRPVYRAYDVGVEFNENYVDLMYRIARRDLGLYLYDNNNRPVRDAQGRLIVLSNRWGETETLTLTKSDVRWIATINTHQCVPNIDLESIPRNKTLKTNDEGQVLTPDTVYEARLVPLLLHEDFSSFSVGTVVNGPDGKLGGWKVCDKGTTNSPSQWEIGKTGAPPSYYIVQKSNIWGGDIDGKDAVKPGTYLLRDDDPNLSDQHLDQPSNWTDYRLSVYLRTKDDDAVGVVFRHLDSQNYLFFAMDRERKYRRLVRVINGHHKILAQDDFVYVQDKDYLITVEAIGSSLRVYQDKSPVFTVVDPSLPNGTIGLYCWGSMRARFLDVRVDDFRKTAPVAYRFKFTTSRFTNFFHHIHSFQDETWQQELPTTTNINAQLSKAVPLATKPSEQEARDYQTLVASVFGPTARPIPKEVQVTQIDQNNQTRALLIESPEPIDWKRTKLDILHTGCFFPKPTLPVAVKLTDVTFGKTQPNQESVSLLLRDTTDLTRHRIEYRHLPGPVAEPTGDPVMLSDDFSDAAGGILFREEFGPNVMDHYTIVDEGSEHAPSNWVYERQARGGTYVPAIVQSRAVYGGSVTGTDLGLPGTMSLTGSKQWTDLRVRVTLRSMADGAIGIVFRYQNENNYYRFFMGNFLTGSMYCLSKKVSGKFEPIWRNHLDFKIGRFYHVVIEAYGDRLMGYVDNALVFSVQDKDIASGQVGLYCWNNNGAIFEALEVERLESNPLLWQPTLTDLKEWTTIDDENAVQGPSGWDTANGVLTQSAGIHVPDNVAQSTIYKPGTYLLGGDEDWEDVELSVCLGSDVDGAIGAMFRITPYFDPSGELAGHNYYRFSMDRKGGYRRLIKKTGNTITQLWSDTVAYNQGQAYEITLRAVGSELCGYLDGTLLFKRYDDELKYGQVGLYCWANPGTRFGRVVVADRTRRVGRWTIKDEGTMGAPSLWRISNDSLLQLSNIAGGASPGYPGTYALAGDSGWTDCRLTVRLRSDDKDGIGIIFRYVDPNNYYRFSVDKQNNRCMLVTKKAGTVQKLAEKNCSYTVGVPFTLTVDVIGKRLVCYMGDERLFDVTDASHAAGKVGLYCWGNNAARFEQVEVRRPSLEAYALLLDRFAEGSIKGWGFVNEGSTAGPADWEIHEGGLRQTTDIYSPPIDRDTLSKLGTQAVAGTVTWSDVIVSVRMRSVDDDTIGLLFRYGDADHYYRLSMDSQRSYRRLVKNVGGNFTLLWEDNFAYKIGQTYELTIVAIGSTLRGYFDGVPMFVVEDGDLFSGRIGLYCWGNHDAQFSQVRVYPSNLAFNNWLLDESFDLLIDDRWTFIDQEGEQEAQSKWQVTGGELRYTGKSHMGTGRRDMINKLGVCALAGDTDWSDYRLSVMLRTDANVAIGAVFRYQDVKNYYRFAMNPAQPYRVLTKMVNGQELTLKSNSDPIVLKREYILTIDCIGEQLTVYLDGIEVFSVMDKDISSGCIGLYCWKNTGARFREVRVAAPVWQPYYTFGRETKLPSGTQIQVVAGSEKTAPQDKLGVVRRFIAPLDESGRLRLSSDRTNLRLKAPGATGGHERRFLPDSDYETVQNAKVLRNVDGTGFFLMDPQAGSVLRAGHYRLEMTYLRDNKSADPSGQILNQAGNKGPEKVKIDIPSLDLGE